MKKFFLSLLCCLLFVQSVQAGELLESLLSFFTGEPAIVRELREREVVMEEEGFLEYYFSQLSGEEQRLYRELLEGVRAYQEEIYLSSSDGAQIDRAYHALLRDHPELFWVHTRGVVYKTLYRSYAILEPAMLEGHSIEDITVVQEAMNRGFEEVCSYFSGDESDYQKVHTVYAWVIQNTVYASGDADQSLEGVFAQGEAVCAGYACAVQYLLERLGIPCIYVAGDSSQSGGDGTGHAWNMVELDGQWYYLDATNGDQPGFLLAEGMEVQPVLFDYLCPFPEEYEAISVPDKEFSVPEATSRAYQDAVQKGGFFSYYDETDVQNYARDQIAQGYSRIRLKFENAQEFQLACQQLLEEEKIQEIVQYYMDFYGISAISYHYGVLEELNTVYLMF